MTNRSRRSYLDIFEGIKLPPLCSIGDDFRGEGRIYSRLRDPNRTENAFACFEANKNERRGGEKETEG